MQVHKYSLAASFNHETFLKGIQNIICSDRSSSLARESTTLCLNNKLLSEHLEYRVKSYPTTHLVVGCHQDAKI